MLDSLRTYRQYDPDDIYFGIEHLAEQVRIAWGDTRTRKLPSSYRRIKNIVIAGMGGSLLGPEIVATAFADRLTVPVSLVHDYALPAWADSHTLVVLSSFSGTTEEVLAVAEQAKKRRCKVLAIAAGGALMDMARTNKWPMYIFAPGDLAKEPRLGVGFSVVGVLGLLLAAGVVKVTDGEIRRMLSAMGDVLDSCAVDVPTPENPAKTVAEALASRSVLLVGAEHLVGNIHTLTNQINETGKQFAVYFTLPELNHHLLEGLTYPKGVTKGMTAMMLRSPLYHPRVQKRMEITASLFEQLGLQVVDYVTGGNSEAEECAEVLQFGSFVSYYLGMLNKVNPRAIPYVMELKKRMSE